jgi:hypothetical protein
MINGPSGPPRAASHPVGELLPGGWREPEHRAAASSVSRTRTRPASAAAPTSTYPPPLPPLWLEFRHVASILTSYLQDQVPRGSVRGGGLESEGLEREADLGHRVRVPGRLPPVR